MKVKSERSTMLQYASVLLFTSEIWPKLVEDVRRLFVFDHRCSRSLVRVSSEQHISDAAVWRMVPGKRSS